MSATLIQLIDGKDKLGHESGEIKKVSFTDIKSSAEEKTLLFRAVAIGAKSQYEVEIFFDNISFKEKKDADHQLLTYIKSIPFYATMPSIHKTPAKVKCSCSDYKYTWANANNDKDAHYGSVDKFTVNGRGKPRNEKNQMGLCKHLSALTTILLHKGKLHQ
jgi:hypothetical protein